MLHLQRASCPHVALVPAHKVCACCTWKSSAYKYSTHQYRVPEGVQSFETLLALMDLKFLLKTEELDAFLCSFQGGMSLVSSIPKDRWKWRAENQDDFSEEEASARCLGPECASGEGFLWVSCKSIYWFILSTFPFNSSPLPQSRCSSVGALLGIIAWRCQDWIQYGNQALGHSDVVLLYGPYFCIYSLCSGLVVFKCCYLFEYKWTFWPKQNISDGEIIFHWRFNHR